jgi:hypothetical protein
MMKKMFCTLGTVCVALMVLTAFGCAPADDTPPIDPVKAKQQPGADTPPAPSNGITAAQTKNAKSGD